MAKKRLDNLLVEKGHFASRPQAQRAVLAGWVKVNEAPVFKPGKLCEEGAALLVSARPRYVSRGGDKLKGALKAFRIEVKSKVALDVGASTGGFTDCLLQAGASRVYSVDVGRGQLAWRIRQDPRVKVMEGCNARYLKPTDLPETVDLIVIDVSFISLTLILPAVARLLKNRGLILALIKPQFEAGREQVKKGGVIRDGKVHQAVLQRIRAFAEKMGMTVKGTVESILIGPAGNKEFFILLENEL